MSGKAVLWFRGAAILALLCLMSGCASTPGYVGLLQEAVIDSFSEGMSVPVRNRLIRLRDLPYAQLYVRSYDGEEAVFMLAEQGRGSGYDLWYGSSGVALMTDGLHVRYADGLLGGVEGSESVRDGMLARYLRGEAQIDEIDVGGESSVLWLRTKGSDEWQEQTGTIESVQEIYYLGFAYAGPALRVVENVTTTGRSGEFQRRYWIETRTHSLLRIETRLEAGAEPVVLEWIRTADRSDQR